MKALFLFLLLSFLLCQFSCTHLPCATSLKKQKSLPKYSIDNFLKIETSFSGSYSPNFNDFIYISNKSGVFNIWKYDVNTKKNILFIKSKENISFVFWNKTNNKIYYFQDNKGNENDNVYEYNPKTKKSRRVIGRNSTTVQFVAISRDYSKLMYIENKRNKKYFDFYSFNFKTRRIKLIWKNSKGYNFQHWLEKKNQIVLSQTLGDSKNTLFLYDLNSKTETHLILDLNHSYYVNDADLDENHLYLVSDKDGQFFEGYKFNIKSKQSKKIISHKWNVTRVGSTFNKKYYYYFINENGYFKLHLFKDEFKTKIKAPTLKKGQISLQTLDRDEKHAAFRYKSDDSPGDIYLWDIETNKTQRVTNNLPDSINEKHLVSSIPVSYKSRDGLTIHGFLYIPKQPMPTKGYPAIMNIHGGPKHQYTPSFRASIQYLLNNGYAVFAPNVRGSTGYGKDFHLMDNLDFGGKPLYDVVDGKHYLTTLDFIDPDRIGIYGGSYGGYMVLAALAFTPKAFKVGVDIVGPSNLMTLVKSFPSYWTAGLKYIYAEFGDPKKDHKYMIERSPLFAADKIVAPLIIFHGNNDVRVRLPEAQSIYKAIKKRKGIVELHVYNDEGHGFYRTKNRIDYLKKTIEFLNKHL